MRISTKINKNRGNCKESIQLLKWANSLIKLVILAISENTVGKFYSFKKS